MKFRIRLDGKEFQVHASPGGKVVIDGQEFVCTVEAPDAGRRVVKLGGKTYDIRVVENQKGEGAFLLELAGERIPVTVEEVAREVAVESKVSAVPPAQAREEVPAAAQGARWAVHGAPGAAEPSTAVKDGVWAPMPGKIVAVRVKPGDIVKEGDPVVVLEAMKMENELHAPRDGRVTAVLVELGAQVERGQLLVALE